jgi:methyltransferase
MVRNGPYRYLRHPNYVIVVIELFAVPLMFDAYITACIISLMNACVLFVRIRIENQAITDITSPNHR